MVGLAVDQPSAVRTWLQARPLNFPAERKLLLLDNATMIEDLKVPPSNRLEALYGDREGQHSICVNAQWRLCFVWIEQGIIDVEIVDYH